MQKKIIELLTKTDGYVSGSEISEQLGVSRQAVWKAINNLKEQGYKIDSVTNRGYRLVAYPPHLNEPAIEKYLKTSVIGKNLIDHKGNAVENIPAVNPFVIECR